MRHSRSSSNVLNEVVLPREKDLDHSSCCSKRVIGYFFTGSLGFIDLSRSYLHVKDEHVDLATLTIDVINIAVLYLVC